MTPALIAGLAAAAAALWRYFRRARRLLHLLQLEHYENARLYVWLRRRHELVDRSQASIEATLAAAATGLTAAGASAAATAACWLALVAVLLAGARGERGRPEITPLVLTDRAKRLRRAALAPPAAVVAIGVAASVVLDSDLPLAIAILLAVAARIASPGLLTAANRALRPVERRVNARFVTQARNRLAEIDPRVVAVTGSFGKTTTKVCIGAVLETHEPTLITPASFNSYLGVVRAINEHLAPDHRTFVVEMGMYRAGDIAELCELVHPSIGVLTAIGPVHLERLGSIEAIADAKAELARALPPDGQLVVNADDPRCLAIADDANVDTTLYGVENASAGVRAERIVMVDGRTHFDLVLGTRRAAIDTKLLGRHNVGNLLAAAAVGHLAGMRLEEIKRGLERVEPPEHRLQTIENAAAGIVVIDDAYNSNPTGAAAALEVLRDHPAKRRILVTPGMVELGDEEDAANEELGRQAADVCDHVILVGPTRTKPIRDGLRAKGFDAVTVVQDIGAATRVLAGLTRAGDVVLFENDLPDMYAEESAA